MQIGSDQYQNSHVDSDSSENSDDNLDEFMKHKLSQQSKSPQNQSLSLGFKLCIALYLIFILSLCVVYINNNYITPRENQDTDATNNQEKIDKSTEAQRSTANPALTHQVIQAELDKASKEAKEQQIIPTLKQLTGYKQINNALFDQAMTSKAIAQKETEHWLVKYSIVCIPDHTVNSATHLVGELYSQGTAYQDLNLVTQSLSIPAQNIYYFQAPRQLMQNLSAALPNAIVAYDHYSPTLLVLGLRIFQQGMLVSDRNNWPLFEKNIILNDAYPRANVYPHEILIKSSVYSILITHDISLAMDTLVVQEREVIILIDFISPTRVKTSNLHKIKVYRLSDGQQCSTRNIELYEEANWRIEEQAYLLPGWYVLNYPDNDITFGTQQLDYHKSLISQNPPECRSLKPAQARKSYFAASDFHIVQLPYTQTYWVDKDQDKPSEYYEQIFAYLTKQNPKGLVFLDSGPVLFLFAAVASLPASQNILLNSEYSSRKELMKLLVLNSQEKVKIADKIPDKTLRLDLTLTSNHETLLDISSAKYILLNEAEVSAFPSYSYSLITRQDCGFPRIVQVQSSQSSLIHPGTYLVSKVQ